MLAPIPSKIVILVPQGQEYQAIAQGVGEKTAFAHPRITVTAIPLGIHGVTEFLQAWHPPTEIEGILVMGLAGALSPRVQLGQVVVYQALVGDDTQNQPRLCHPAWSQSLSQQLHAPLVTAYPSPELVATAQAKQTLQQQTQAEVVDMEGGPILDYGFRMGIPVAMVRVISDQAGQDLPNLSGAIQPDGRLNPLALAWAFLQKPMAAAHLISGSLQGLAVLRQTAAQIGMD